MKQENTLFDVKDRLDCQQACTLLGCRKSHFYRLVASGLIPAVRSGSRRGITVSRQDLLAYKVGCEMSGND